jgi:MSHA biogenesis protein MshJ
MDKRLSDLINWLNEREERERIAILVGSCIIISMLWYLFLEKPLILSRLRIHHQIESLQKQTLFFRNEANGILIHTGALKQQEKTNVQENAEFQTLNIHFASPEGNNELVKAILAPLHSVKIMDLKSIIAAVPAPAPAKPDATPKPAAAPSKDGYQVIFESDFMNTLAYLKALEKLPWCLSWDSLEYTVETYPTASVAVTLHLVSD